MILRNSTIVVTGATGGIGRELIKKLDAEGALLILVSRSESELKNLGKTLSGKNNAYFSCDLSNQSDAERLGKEISGQFKTVDVLINAAGIGIYKPIEDLTLQEWNRAMNVNINSPFIVTKALIENLKRSNDAVVINMGSGTGETPIAGRSSYSTTKFALRGWSLAMSKEFKHANVSFCLMTLGSVLTSFGPMSLEEKRLDMESGKGYLTPEWVADKVIEILKSGDREEEYKFYPSGYLPPK